MSTRPARTPRTISTPRTGGPRPAPGAGTASGTGPGIPTARFPLLSALTAPAVLRDLTHDDLSALAAEIRAFLIGTVCATGGHLGPNLGVVELSIALHRVFASPWDTVLFDIGHQGYVLGRAFDQVLMDVAPHRLPVTFVLDRAGITGPDGPSHHGMWDLTLLGAVPGMRVGVPRDATRLRELLAEAVTHTSGPTALRFPKAAVTDDIPAYKGLGPVEVLHQSRVRDVLLVTVGPLAGPAVEAARYRRSAQRPDRADLMTAPSLHARSTDRRTLTDAFAYGLSSTGTSFRPVARCAPLLSKGADCREAGPRSRSRQCHDIRA
ncbi:1-deoxy-D-xylulose-5-phosphate synthase N-terminal domain-containing protein [Streptomyces sp. NPDC020379]|uniref:1-deoxy-D-xylulose-5-phosphate synthase N-terminal domain-containing protein n=1 Tax=Streptomyces sp. NPDC020379 TaxID=3365071 RepID=UPI0037A09498